MNTKDVLLAALVGALVASLTLLAGGLVDKQSAELGASGTRFPNGISTDSTSPSAGQIRGTSLTITGDFTGATGDFSGEFEAAIVEEGTIATLTAGPTSSPTAAQVCDNNILQWAPSVPTGTSTLPASSALTADCLSTNGDRITLLFRNTSSSSNFVILAGDASTTLNGSTANDDVIDGGNEALISIWRTGTDTVVVDVEERVDID